MYCLPIRFEFYAKTLYFRRGTLGPLIFLPPTPRAIASPGRWAILEMIEIAGSMDILLEQDGVHRYLEIEMGRGKNF